MSNVLSSEREDVQKLRSYAYSKHLTLKCDASPFFLADSSVTNNPNEEQTGHFISPKIEFKMTVSIIL